MKKFIYSLNVLIAGFVMCISTANAATYTAEASGNWSDAATWGGSAPGNHLTFDNVVIPAGITVTLDQDVEFDGGLLFSMQVNGTLASNSTSKFYLSSGSITGNGDITLGYMEVSGLSTFSFSGDMEVDRFVNDVAINLNLGAHITVSDSLILNGGSLTFGNGSNLILSTDAVVKRRGGSIAVSGGIITANNDYHVLYAGSSATSGIETSWTGMKDMMINFDNENQVLSLGTDAEVHGEVKQMKGWINLNGNDLTIHGNYNNTSASGFRGNAGSSLIIMSDANWTSDLWFEDGSEDLDDLHLNMGEAMSVKLMSDLKIHGDLILEEGELKVMGGSSLIMQNNSNVKVDQGSISTDNGVFNGNNSYNVWYVGSASETGIEMSGTGMNDLTLNLDEESGAVMMTNNTTINGDLHLMKGNWDMNGKNLTLSGGFHAEETGWMMGDENSSLTINGNANWTDTMWFADNGNTIDALNLNLTGGHHIMIGSDLNLNDLNLNNGSVLIFDNMITVKSGGTVTGYDEDNYVMIDGDGQLKMEMTSGGSYTTFPVGTEDGYSPVMIQYNTGATSSFMVGVEKGVYAVGTYGDDLTETESIVDRTWTVNSTAGATSNIDMKVWWSQAMEVNGFNRTNARISGFTGGNWDYSSMSAAVTTSNGMYELSRDGVTNMGRFAVTDANSALEVPQNGSLIAGVYPNPADEKLNIALDGAAQIELIDAYGKIVSSVDAKQSGVVEMDLVSLPSGVYFVKANANGTFTTQKVVKK